MKRYRLDFDCAALGYQDSVARLSERPGYHMLDAVLIKVDLEAQRPYLNRQQFCWHCENFTAKTARRPTGEYRSLWVDAEGRPLRPGASDPLKACGSCVLGKCNETKVHVVLPRTLEGKIEFSRAMINILRQNPERWRRRLDAEEKRLHQLEDAAEIRSGKRRILVQHFKPLRGRPGLSCEPAGDVEEHWESVQAWDPAGVGNNWPVRERQQRKLPR